MSKRQLGPIIGATLLTANINKVINAYRNTLGFTLEHKHTVSEALASFWQAPKLIGAPMAIMASANGDAWLRIVEDTKAAPAKPLRSYGWMSLETNVGDVDQLRTRFVNDEFNIIGEPAYLQVSDAIKAMQVIGPAGEVSYLTQVDRAVPPFELPMTKTTTGSLFIPVLCTPNREKSLSFYQNLNAADAGLKFETKITVLNNALGKDIEHQYPVSTLQLDGKCLFEIDQVGGIGNIVNNTDSLPSGIAMITCKVKNINALAEKLNKPLATLDDIYYGQQSALLLKGPSGELIELVG
jgi:hypothetical protein